MEPPEIVEFDGVPHREWRPSPNGHRATLPAFKMADQSRLERKKPKNPDIDSRLKLQLPPREHLLEPILPAKGLAMVYAPRGIGKTHVALGIAYACASGGTLSDGEPRSPDECSISTARCRRSLCKSD